MKIKIKVTPRAKQNKIVGYKDGVLRVRLTAAPVDGKANAALIDYLAEEWSISRSGIKIIHGETSREKVLEVPGSVSLPLQKTLI